MQACEVLDKLRARDFNRDQGPKLQCFLKVKEDLSQVLIF